MLPRHRPNSRFRREGRRAIEGSLYQAEDRAEETQKVLESTYETVKTVSGDLSLKTIAALRPMRSRLSRISRP